MEGLFIKYMDQKNSLTKSFYDHHKLRPRTIRTKQNIRNSVSSHTNTDSKSSNLINTTQKIKNSVPKMQPSRFPEQKSKPHIIKKLTIGRNLFRRQIQNNKELGPGQYSPTILRSKSFGYIPKQSDQSMIPSKKIKQKRLQFLGPGRYQHENAQNMLSTHRTLYGGTFSAQKLIRCIIPKQKEQKINLRINEQSENAAIWNRKLGPGCYNVQKSQGKITNYVRSACLPLSMTQRSSLIKNDKLPGPGYYNWFKLIDNNQKPQNSKPKIQFKFVHGNT